ncbi:DedA family protein [Agromyces intestinalis]|uniref:DedA family protein n=1 Tax=Agromyces intestinalis TaxID=2592652 RepID=A0A5C1YC10_9MICO|nr:DedA family protein [Agromyces intestinalis]
MNDVLDWILQTVQGVDPLLRTLLAGVGVMLETSILIGLIVPGDTIVLVASTAIENPVQYVALVVAVIAGALAGESIGFAIGRWFGLHLVRSRLGRRIGEAQWTRAQRYVDRRGGPAVFLSRFLPVLHSLVPLVVGMSAMRYRRFIAWTLPACVIWAFAYATVGWLAADSYRELSRELHWAGYIFVAVIALFLVVVWLAKRVIVRLEARHFEADATGADAGATDATAASTAEGPDAVASDPSDTPETEAPEAGTSERNPGARS